MIQRKFSDRFLQMKIRLALSTENLQSHGLGDFAGYINCNLESIYTLFDNIAGLQDGEEIEKLLNEVIARLTEIQNVLLASKLGTAKIFEKDTMEVVAKVKTEVNEIIKRREYNVRQIL